MYVYIYQQACKISIEDNASTCLENKFIQIIETYVYVHGKFIRGGAGAKLKAH